MIQKPDFKEVSLILFDFDGTISDSHEAAIEVYNSLSDRFGHRKVDKTEVSTLRNRTTKEVFEILGLSPLKLPFLVREARKKLQLRINTITPFEGMAEALAELKRQGYRLGILTSNSQDNVLQFLKVHGMDVFDFVHSGASIFGKAKVMRNLLSKQGISASQVAYVGDETRDVEAAKAAGIRTISVTWGFNSRQILETVNPDSILDSPLELAKLFTKIIPE